MCISSGRLGEGRSVGAGWCALTSLSPRPTVFVSFLSGRRQTLMGQISVKMAIDAMVEAAVSEGGERHDASALVRTCVKEANLQLHRYGAKMLSGAKIAARGFVFAFDGAVLSACRVGGSYGALVRGGDVVHLFDEVERDEGFIGAEPSISVDVTTVQVEVGDLFLFTSGGDDQGLVCSLIGGADSKPVEELSREVARALVRTDSGKEEGGVALPVSVALRVESSSIFLEEVVDD